MANLKDSFDYVVVGAGSAGCVVASRLSEDQHSTVLLLEAGPSDEDFPAIYVPAQVATLQKTKIDWGFKTVPQRNAARGITAGEITWPRGKVLGGSSCLNYMAYVRGHSSDYDSWERLGCQGWGWKDVLPYFMKSENNACEEHTDPKFHNVGGPLTVSNHPSFRSQFSREFIKAGVELGYKEVDISSGDNVIIEDQKVVGVDYLLGDQTKSVHVNREVAVCGGAVNSPQILMLSGIGPRSHLESLGIECIADLPVGKNLQDHLSAQLKASAESGALSLNDLMDPKHLEQYKLNHEGALTNNFLESVGFIKTSLESDDDWPDLQIHILPVYYGIGPDEPDIIGIKSKDFYSCLGYHTDMDTVMSYKGVIILPVLLHPKSVGEITLASKDPKAPPIIDPHYLEHPHDVKVLIEGLRFSKSIAETNIMRNLGIKVVNPKMPGTSADAFSDENLEDCIRHFASTTYHPVGTCKMGSVDDSSSVVDPELRVHGIKGLRVIDASIMPHITSGNTNAPCIMIGEKGADMIKSVFISGK